MRVYLAQLSIGEIGIQRIDECQHVYEKDGKQNVKGVGRDAENGRGSQKEQPAVLRLCITPVDDDGDETCKTEMETQPWIGIRH